MYQDFDKMSVSSRVWIYQADRNLTAKEENMSAYFIKQAITNWEAHSVPLSGSVNIFESRFIVIALDEDKHAASGCSIDSSTHWIQKLGSELNVDFFDRSLAYLDGKEIKSVPIFNAKSAILNGTIKSDTLVFNNRVTNLQGLKSVWKIPANQLTFIKRHFQKEVA
ncbi:MAG: hypothetical protein ACI9DJ_001916 [Algoriphagus sp.]|jgi:hypothetical protein